MGLRAGVTARRVRRRRRSGATRREDPCRRRPTGSPDSARGVPGRSRAAPGRGAAARADRRGRPPDLHRRPRTRSPTHRRLAAQRAHPRVKRVVRAGRASTAREAGPRGLVVLRHGVAAVRPRRDRLERLVRRRRRRADAEPHRRALPGHVPALHGGARTDDPCPGVRRTVAPLARRLRPGPHRRDARGSAA